MPRLTLRTLLAYLDDTLEPDQARDLGQKVAESDEARVLIERIRKVTRRRGLTAPTAAGDEDDVSDPNVVAAYLSDSLSGPQLRELEETCLDSDVHLAEVAACHQILTLVLTKPMRVPPSANQRMYGLAEPPAGDPSKKPGPTVPVGGVMPPTVDHPDADDPDAALLLGMKRYGASDSWAGRLGLLGAVAAVAVFLAFAVLMALPRRQPDAPETSPNNLYALVTTPTVAVPTPGSGLPVAPDPKPVDPGKEPVKVPMDPKEPVGKKPDDVKKDPEPAPKLGDPVKAPQGGNEDLGDMRTENVLVLTRGPEANAGWLRIDPTNPVVRANTTVLALPGFKADVKLTSGVVVTLWGNVPEQVAMRAMVMHSRVRFHPPADGFAADITLEAGRVYLKSSKPAGSKVRLRVGNEVWDVALNTNASDVFAQVGTAFVPGTPFAREGGEKPKTEVHIGVIGGTAEITAPARWKKIESVAAGNEVTWNSKNGTLSDKQPLPPDLFSKRVPELEAEFGKALQRVLSDAATKLTNADGVRVLLKERLIAPPPAGFPRGLNQLQFLAIVFPTQWAAYSHAAILEGGDAPEMLKDMVDALGDTTRSYARQSAVVALSSWVAQAPGNTDLLMKAMVAKGWRDDDVELIARLIRGYSAASTGDTAAVDALVDYLDHQQIAVREGALANLYAFFDPEAVNVPELRMDVAARKEPGAEKAYESFLKAWKARAEEIKKRMMEKK